jgi:hypothetical protein
MWSPSLALRCRPCPRHQINPQPQPNRARTQTTQSLGGLAGLLNHDDRGGLANHRWMAQPQG